jgi:hypothetical protein
MRVAGFFMKVLRKALFFFALVPVGSRLAAMEPVQWNYPGHQAQFSYFTENGSPDEASWTTMPPAEQDSLLKQAQAPAARKLEAVGKWYAGTMRKWSTPQLRDYT